MSGMKTYKHISLAERELIFLYLHLGKSHRQIAQLLARNHRTISREINRNKDNNDNYSVIKAQDKADKRRQESKLGSRKLDSLALQDYVIRRLGKGWSPEQIAGRLKKINSRTTISHETVYQFIYSKQTKKLKLYELLRRQRPKRQSPKSRKVSKKGIIPNRVFIDNRPDIINQRKQIGHWETDLMEGPRQSKSHVTVSIERVSRLVRLSKIEDKKASTKTRATISQLKSFPRSLVKSITYDNGTENHYHQTIAKNLNCYSYFCNPYHSWEKGSVENVIGLVRQYLPKGTNLENITQGELSWIAWQLNHRPKKVLNYLTPSEKFFKETGWVT